MQNNKHYYLIQGKVMVSDSKMPAQIEWNTYFIYKHKYNNGLPRLQPCDIDDSELDKIDSYFYEKWYQNNNGFDSHKQMFKSNPIDITDIVFEKDGKIYFKQPQQFGNTEQPKQVESDDIDFLIEQSFKLGVQWGETYGGWFNPNKEDNERKLKECKETVKQLYEIFKKR